MGRMPRWIWLAGGVLILGLGYIFITGGNPAECERLMRAYESNTADKEALQRLDAECPAWESMR